MSTASWVVGLGVLGGAVAAFAYFAKQANAMPVPNTPTGVMQAACWTRTKLGDIQKLFDSASWLASLKGRLSDQVFLQATDRLGNICSGASAPTDIETAALQKISENQSVTNIIDVVQSTFGAKASAGFLGWQWK